MRVLMVGRRPSIALDDLRRYWGEIEFSPGSIIPKPRRYDLVIAQEPTLRIGVPALMQAKLSRGILICEVHSNYLQAGFLPRRDLVAAKLVLRSAEHVRAVSKQIAGVLKNWNVKNILTIPSIYIKLNLFRPLSSHQVRGPVVVSVSRLVPQKGIRLLLDSVPYLVKNFPGVEVRIVGEGPERRSLELYAERLGVMGRVRFHGWVTQDELVKHYNEAAVFVCTSLHEGGPRTIFEAAACHTPFVSTAVGLVPEVYRHGREGFILQRRDAERLAEYVSILLSDPGLREEMGRRGREVVEREFEWEGAVRRYAEAYLRLLGG
ncbi:MAG: glycosyltransferase family 4 protein [Nitrososphaerota archaeon]